MMCFLNGLVFHRDASHLWWENDLKERALGKAEVGMTEGGIGSCLGKTQQKAADCLKLLRGAQTTSNIARLDILSSAEIFLWLGWNPFQSCACDMRGGELSMPRHLSSSCPQGRARLNCWSSVTFPLPRNVWRTIAGEQQWHQTWENPAHLSQLEFCQKQLLYI